MNVTKLMVRGAAPLVGALAAVLALAPGPAFAGSDAETNVFVNGNLKAEGWFYSHGNNFCSQLFNAPNGGYTFTQVLVDNGPALPRVEDHSNDGTRSCGSFGPNSYDGRSGTMYISFIDARGHTYTSTARISI